MRRRHGSDRRRFERLSPDVLVSCIPRVDDEVVEARTLNFSAGGVLFVSSIPLEAGVDVDIELQLAGAQDDLRFPGRIVRVRTMSDHAHEIAVEFAGGDAGHQRLLLDFIELHAGASDYDPTPPLTA